MVGLGASEAWTSSLVPPEDAVLLSLPASDSLPASGGGGLPPIVGELLEVENPLAQEESALRARLLPGLVRAVASNSAHQDPFVRLFEVGRVFGPPAQGEELPDECEVMALALAWRDDGSASAVAAWRSLASVLRLANVRLEPIALPGMHPTRSARLVAGSGPVPGEADPGGPVSDGIALGGVGEVAPAVLAGCGLPGRHVGWLEVDLAALAQAPRLSEQAQPVSRFPSAELDLAFVVDYAVPAADLEASLRRAAGDLLASIALFDVFEGGQLGPSQRSLAFRLRFAALDRTLDEAELGRLRARCVEVAESEHGATLRT
jgi:phenylalanyl-tRNA synthetase beta chain